MSLSNSFSGSGQCRMLSSQYPKVVRLRSRVALLSFKELFPLCMQCMHLPIFYKNKMQKKNRKLPLKNSQAQEH